MKKKAHSAEFKFKVVLEEIRWQKTRGRSCATNWGCEQQPDFQVEAGCFEPWDGRYLGTQGYGLGEAGRDDREASRLKKIF